MIQRDNALSWGWSRARQRQQGQLYATLYSGLLSTNPDSCSQPISQEYILTNLTLFCSSLLKSTLVYATRTRPEEVWANYIQYFSWTLVPTSFAVDDILSCLLMWLVRADTLSSSWSGTRQGQGQGLTRLRWSVLRIMLRISLSSSLFVLPQIVWQLKKEFVLHCIAERDQLGMQIVAQTREIHGRHFLGQFFKNLDHFLTNR